MAASMAAYLAGGCVRHRQSAAGGAAPAEPSVKVGLVLDKGGRDDKSFNSAAFAGATKAASALGARVKTVESPDDSAFEPSLRAFAERGFPLIVAIGFAQVDAVRKVAPEFPQAHFAIVDGAVDLPNVANLLFAEHEGSYLVGYLAGLASKTGRVGFIGGMDIPMIRRFQLGYESGVKAARPSASLYANYVGINSSAWANPARGKELALGQYERGVDVIFAAAGASGTGVFDAVEEKKALVIGVDSNQNCVKPGRVLSSMLKRVDEAVYDAIAEAARGKFRSGTRAFGLADKGIDYAVDECNAALVGPYRERLERERAKILAGALKVPDYYDTHRAQ
jgi:basic membrane protein A